MFRIIIPPLSLWSDSISNNAIGLFLCKWYVLYCFLLLLKSFRDYLSGSVAKNPPSNALDIVQSLVKEVRAHTLQGNEANRALLQHLCAVTGEACTVQLLSPCALELLCHKRSPCATTKSPSAAAKTQSSKKKKKSFNIWCFGVQCIHWCVWISFFLIYSYFCGMVFFNSLGRSLLSLNSTYLPFFAFCPFGNYYVYVRPLAYYQYL